MYLKYIFLSYTTWILHKNIYIVKNTITMPKMTIKRSFMMHYVLHHFIHIFLYSYFLKVFHIMDTLQNRLPQQNDNKWLSSSYLKGPDSFFVSYFSGVCKKSKIFHVYYGMKYNLILIRISKTDCCPDTCLPKYKINKDIIDEH